MLTRPFAGWTQLLLEADGGSYITKPCSYITEVPIDLSECFLRYMITGSSICEFDGESEGIFCLVLQGDKAYFADDDEESVKAGLASLIVLAKSPLELAVEFYGDVANSTDAWAKNFSLSMNKEEELAFLHALEYSIDGLKFSLTDKGVLK